MLMYYVYCFPPVSVLRYTLDQDREQVPRQTSRVVRSWPLITCIQRWRRRARKLKGPPPHRDRVWRAGVRISQALQAGLNSAFKADPRVSHLKIEDGSGRRLGRSFRVNLWPTLFFKGTFGGLNV